MNGYNDVLVALQWVQADISNFGGDPNQVSLMGESSGSVAACALNTSPRAAGLFQVREQAMFDSATSSCCCCWWWRWCSVDLQAELHLKAYRSVVR